LGELQTQVQQLWPSEVDLSALSPETTDRESLRESLVADALAAYDRREDEFGDEVMRQLERAILLQLIDNRWREHLAEMDYLREGIHLRGFAQIDPLVAYKNEGFSMFEVLMYSIWEEFARMIFHVQVEVAPQAQQELAPAQRPANVNYSGGTLEAQPSAMEEVARAAAAQAGGGAPGVTGPPAASPAPAPAAAQGGNGEPTNPQTVVKDEQEKIGRNDPCWCGSGKKYKKCHGA
jgi:preprotein translocase subunit SecA